MLKDHTEYRQRNYKSLILTVVFVLALVFTLPTSAAGDDTEKMDHTIGTFQKVYVVIGERTTPVMISGGSNKVEDVLERMDLTLGEMDTVEPELGTRVREEDTIVIHQKAYVTETESGVVPFETIYHYSSETTPGEETVLVEGKDGFGDRTFKRLVEDGKVIEEEIIATNYTETPINKEVAIGFRCKPITEFDFEWKFDENGEPINPVKVLRGQKSTAYTAAPNSSTASGLPAQVGHVAVNPEIIPYGSKLFIQASDGSEFIYGYAIAADTGLALMDGRAGIDLYYDNMDECINHGVKNMDVFVLESPM